MKKILFTIITLPMMANASVKTTYFNDDSKGFEIIKSEKPTVELMVNETTEEDEYIRFFFNLGKNYKQELNNYNKSKYAYDSKVLDTHIKANLSDIQLSIPYKEPKELTNKILGYAPIGSYKDGWTGIRSFFKDELLGICSYSFEKFIYIQAESNYVRNLVNGKPSFNSISGNVNAGYLYVLSWNVDNKDFVYDYKLECVNKNNDERIMGNMIKLANLIDQG